MSERISRNFEVAKIAAILLVATGHFFGGILWVPVTMALFVFGFSSALFTSSRYCETFAWRPFWKRKMTRLGPDLLVIALFLFILFLWEQRSGIFTVHTVINVFGLTGFLNWFGIRNQSPYGEGLWFFTLLIVFYLAYPLIRHVNRSRVGRNLFIITAFAATTYFHCVLPVGHALWLTAFGFLFGVFYERSGFLDRRVPAGVLVLAGVGLVGTMAAFDYGLSFKGANYFLVLGGSMIAVMWLINASMDGWTTAIAIPLAPCLIEIYFLHPYLFVRPFRIDIADFLVSLVIIIGSAVMLERLARWAKGMLLQVRAERATT